jgi:hypothetical protein
MSEPTRISHTAPATPERLVPRAAWNWKAIRQRAIRRALVLFCLLTLYVLSIGPMWWWWYSGMYLETEKLYWVIVIYEPLRQACRIEIVNDVVTSYIEWWKLPG